jgi:hypothetical protein
MMMSSNTEKKWRGITNKHFEKDFSMSEKIGKPEFFRHSIFLSQYSLINNSKAIYPQIIAKLISVHTLPCKISYMHHLSCTNTTKLCTPLQKREYFATWHMSNIRINYICMTEINT